MGYYRKKPVIIEAELFDGTVEAAERIICWTHGSDAHVRYDAASETLFIDTVDGTSAARPGDFVIMWVSGEFYPCRPEIFHATYDPIGDAA